MGTTWTKSLRRKVEARRMSCKDEVMAIKNMAEKSNAGPSQGDKRLEQMEK